MHSVHMPVQTIPTMSLHWWLNICRSMTFDKVLHDCRVVETDPRIEQIREKVESFAASFPMPGFAVGKEDISNGKVGVDAVPISP